MNGILDAINDEDKKIERIMSFLVEDNIIEVMKINDILRKVIRMNNGFTIFCTSANSDDNGMYDIMVKNPKGQEVPLETFGLVSNYLSSKEVDSLIIGKLKII